jgi:hypothetical protein
MVHVGTRLPSSLQHFVVGAQDVRAIYYYSSNL